MSAYEGAEDETGYEGVDALLAALTDEPLPAGAGDDALFMAEHRSAVADVALLRDQLRLMGDALAGERPPPGRDVRGPRAPAAAHRPVRASAPLRPPEPAGPRRPGRYRRHTGAAVGALVVTAGTALLGGLVWLGVQGGAGGDGSGDSAASKQEDSAGDLGPSPQTHLACAKVLVEGTVRGVTAAGAGNVHVVLEVKRYYRPERSVAEHPTITVTLPEEAREDLKAGTYALVRVPVFARDRLDWETGPGVADARGDILEALPGARGMKCPGPDEGRG
ncbi:hypothetical protein QFZ75_005045 [Streptomyces sp. V3I8]|uniref:hypothetical protein n=1 Tax=Streptomyces sp. V3I8 TaxID=3042279 RepID=UPI00277EBC4B|nr:hypothetical protein [Streptomyces sp. V3I8]MDQ1038629.1 hypothetical protein [Streptomyces sp. V3I8]